MRAQKGFTLVELAIVLLIVGLVLGGLVMPLSVQRDHARTRDAREQLGDIEAALLGFALANGHLPCPATPASQGSSVVAGGACAVQHGFVPATTLGVKGSRNDDNLLLDPWSWPVRYSVTASDADGDGNWDFTAPGEMQDVGMAALLPDLSVCTTGSGSTPTACASASSTLTSSAPVILYSPGKNGAPGTSADENENVGTSLGGGPSGRRYAIAADLVFVSRQASDQPGNTFDDQLSWLAPGSLYHRLVAGGQLP